MPAAMQACILKGSMLIIIPGSGDNSPAGSGLAAEGILADLTKERNK